MHESVLSSLFSVKIVVRMPSHRPMHFRNAILTVDEVTKYLQDIDKAKRLNTPLRLPKISSHMLSPNGRVVTQFIDEARKIYGGSNSPTAIDKVPLSVLMAHSDLNEINEVKKLTQLSKKMNSAFRPEVQTMMSNVKARAGNLLPLIELTKKPIPKPAELGWEYDLPNDNYSFHHMGRGTYIGKENRFVTTQIAVFMKNPGQRSFSLDIDLESPTVEFHLIPSVALDDIPARIIKIALSAAIRYVLAKKKPLESLLTSKVLIMKFKQETGPNRTTWRIPVIDQSVPLQEYVTSLEEKNEPSKSARQKTLCSRCKSSIVSFARKHIAKKTTQPQH